MANNAADIGVAVGYIEAASLNVMRLECDADQPFECLRCIIGAQLAKALTALDASSGVPDVSR